MLNIETLLSGADACVPDLQKIPLVVAKVLYTRLISMASPLLEITSFMYRKYRSCQRGVCFAPEVC